MEILKYFNITIREIQVKTTMTYYFIPTKMAVIKKTDSNILTRRWRNWNPYISPVEMYNGATILENNLVVSQMIKHEVAI